MRALRIYFCFIVIVSMATIICAQQQKTDEISPELLEKIFAAMAQQQGTPSRSGDINLSALKQKYQNAIVKIEYTAIINQEETKMNPTKSEGYVQIGFRINTYEGNVLHLKPAFPIDESLECRKNINVKLD